MLFETAVEQLQDFMREDVQTSSPPLDYVLAPERRQEAQVVSPCAARFVSGEMDPTRESTVARGPSPSAGAVDAPPSLAEKLGGQAEEREPGKHGRSAAGSA